MPRFLSQLKTFLLKAIDLSALTFLEPVVRLAYGEEPRVQLKKIGRTILVPLVAVALFLTAWTLIADQIQTKSGKLPDPAATWSQASAILAKHQRENQKKAAYDLTGPQREQQLAEVDARLAELDALEPQAQTDVEQAQQAQADAIEQRKAPLITEQEQLKQQIKDAKQQRKETLAQQAAGLTSGKKDAYDQYLEALEDSRVEIEELEAQESLVKARIGEAESYVHPPLIEARDHATALAEERQHLTAMSDFLGRRNRGEKLAQLEEKLAEQKAAFYESEGEAAVQAAGKIESYQRNIDRQQERDYAMPYTLPRQVIRSIMCVFVGFMIGTLIAVPIGIFCGLSPTIMAAMTPFIALFKPVSPIVWLPIMLIIVSGLVGDPDNNPLIQFLWGLPWIGKYEINPAFLASAAVVALCSLWATLANTALGVASIDPDHLNVARVLKLGFWSRLFKIVLPSALPLIFAGMRISLGVGWMVLIAAELLASSEGIGKFVIDMFNNGSSESFAALFVVVFVVGIIGLFLDRIMIILQRAVSFEGSVASI